MELEKLNNNIVEIINNSLAKYEDREGNLLILPITGLICKCEYLRVDEAQKINMEFTKQISKKETFSKKKVVTQVTKDTITNNEEDKNIIVDKEIEVYEMWVVTNGLGAKKIFNNKNDAFIYCNDINDKYLQYIK